MFVCLNGRWPRTTLSIVRRTRRWEKNSHTKHISRVTIRFCLVSEADLVLYVCSSAIWHTGGTISRDSNNLLIVSKSN